MIVNFDSSVANLRDRIQAADKKKTQSDSQSVKGSASSEKKTEESAVIADVIGIRDENKLAAASNTAIQNKEEAFDLLEDLKKELLDNSERAINAHKKASADAVMQFYPFE